jgi:hypothetical protein
MDLGMFSNNKINLNILNLKNDENSIKTIEEVSDRLFKSSLEKIKKHEGLINYIFPILFDRWVLSKEELFKCINEYYSKKNNNNNGIENTSFFDIEEYKSLEFFNENKTNFSIFDK